MPQVSGLQLRLHLAAAELRSAIEGVRKVAASGCTHGAVWKLVNDRQAEAEAQWRKVLAEHEARVSTATNAYDRVSRRG